MQQSIEILKQARHAKLRNLPPILTRRGLKILDQAVRYVRAATLSSLLHDHTSYSNLIPSKQLNLIRI